MSCYLHTPTRTYLPQLFISDPTTLTPSPIPTLQPNEAYRTLGFYIAADGSQLKQFSIIRDKITNWLTIISSTRLTSRQTLIAYKTFLLPAIRYFFPIAQLPTYQLLEQYQRISKIITNALGLNQHFPKAILHGPMLLGGLELPDWELMSISARLATLMYHIRAADDTGKLLSISIQWTQLEIGTNDLFLNLKPSAFLSLTTPTWITSLWKAMSPYNIQFTPSSLPPSLIPTPPRQNDDFIMNLFINHHFTPQQLTTINHCRLYLQVLFISDISNAAGISIDLPYRGNDLYIQNRRISSLRWPIIPNAPTVSQWELWEAAIKKCICTKQFILHSPLGNWINATHQHWPLRTTPPTITLSTLQSANPSTQPVHNSSSPTYTLTTHPTATALTLASTTTKHLRNPRLHLTSEINQQTTTHIASYSQRHQTFTITSTHPAPPVNSTPTDTLIPWHLHQFHALDHNSILNELQHRKFADYLIDHAPYSPNYPIEWEGLKHHVSSLRPPQRSQFVKFQQEWLPTHAHLHKHNAELSPLCPLCSSEPETQRHLYCCSDTRAVAARQTAINNLQDQLRNNKVPLSIRSALSTGLQHLGKTHPQPTAQNASSMQQFISHQNTVGWYSLLRGYIPSVLFDSTYHHPKTSRKKWVAKIISTLYTYHLHIWTTRNNITHPDSAPTFQTTTQHTNLL